jgi:hypothetical protein
MVSSDTRCLKPQRPVSLLVLENAWPCTPGTFAWITMKSCRSHNRGQRLMLMIRPRLVGQQRDQEFIINMDHQTPIFFSMLSETTLNQSYGALNTVNAWAPGSIYLRVLSQNSSAQQYHLLRQPTQPNGLNDHGNSELVRRLGPSPRYSNMLCAHQPMADSPPQAEQLESKSNATVLKHSHLWATPQWPFRLTVAPQTNAITTMPSLHTIRALTSPPMVPNMQQQWHQCNLSESSSYHISPTLGSTLQQLDSHIAAHSSSLYISHCNGYTFQPPQEK